MATTRLTNAALIGLALVLQAQCTATGMNVGPEGLASAPTLMGAESLTPAFGPAMAIDGDNSTSWISAVLMGRATAPDNSQLFRVDLVGAYHVETVHVEWAQSTSSGNLAPPNLTVATSLDGENAVQLLHGQGEVRANWIARTVTARGRCTTPSCS
eukprot:SAG11_NODE_746_length_7383_cov_3.809995_5_plen_156_part_00